MIENSVWAGAVVLFLAVAVFFIVKYLITGKTHTIDPSMPLFSLFVFTYCVIMQCLLRDDPAVSSTVTNCITLTFIIVVCLSDRKSRDGFLFNRIQRKDVLASRPRMLLLMFVNALVIVAFSMAVAVAIQCLLLS